MATIRFSRTVQDGSNIGSFYATITFTLSVEGSVVTYTLTRSDYGGGTISWPADEGMYARVRFSEGSSSYDVVRWEGNDTSISGSFEATQESATVTATIMPGHSYSYVDGESAPTISEVYSGAHINYPPTASVSIPASIAAGSLIPVSCVMSDSNGDSLSGVLKRYYRASSAGSYTATTINNNLRASTTVYDTIPASYGGGKIYYELTVTDGANSVQATSATRTVIANSAPSVPPSLTIPETIAGGSTITITWTASTDPDGNLAGYYLERSTDSGANWTQVYQGAALTTTDFIPVGTTNVRYRIKAYDTYSAESGWRRSPDSGDKSVTNNHAPTTPASPITITPTTLTSGGSAVISWGASTDPDGDYFEYELYRKIDSDSYTKIYSGTNRSYTDTVGAWSTVQYRVKAVDSQNASSGWLTATQKSVTSNAIPTIVVESESTTLTDGQDLGTKTDVFSLTVTPNDANAYDSLTVKEIVDGVVRKTITNATHGSGITFNFRTGSAASTEYWNTLMNGSHTITFSVTDSKSTVSQTFTFLKNVDACLITLKTPIAAKTGKKVDTAVVSICGSIPATGLTAVQVTADGGTTWEDCIIASTETGYSQSGIGNRITNSTDTTTKRIENAELIGGNYIFIKKLVTAGASFNFRVQAQAVTSGDDVYHGYISSVQGVFTEVSAT